MGLNEKQQKALDCYMSMSMRQWPEALHAWIAATSVHDPILSGDGATSPPSDEGPPPGGLFCCCTKEHPATFERALR